MQPDSLKPSPQPEEVIIKKKKMPIWFKLAIFLSVLALIGVTGGILFTESWVDVVDHQLAALREKDIDKAYYAYTSKEFQKENSLDQFRTFVEAHPIFFHNQSAHFQKRTLQDHLGKITGHLTSDEHMNVPIKYKLIKEDGKWKILSIRFLKTSDQQTEDAD